MWRRPVRVFTKGLNPAAVGSREYYEQSNAVTLAVGRKAFAL
jgi:hypothetical protein